MLTATAPTTAVRFIPMTSFPRSRRSALTWSARGRYFWHAGSVRRPPHQTPYRSGQSGIHCILPAMLEIFRLVKNLQLDDA
jgi:hypothetical protein